jgi:hypothetical protein
MAAAGLIALTIFGQLPGSTKLWETLQNSAHAPVFVALSLIVLRFLSPETAPICGRRRHYVKTLLACLCIGTAIELVQALLGRDASVHDVVNDMAGAIIGILASAIGGPPERKHPAAVKRVLGALALLGIAATMAPLAWSAAAYRNRQVRFPVLAEFSSSLDLYFWQDSMPNFELRRLPREWARVRNESALYVPLPNARWPGIELTEPVPNWSAYRSFCADVINSAPSALPLNLRVHDRAHNQKMSDRFNLSFDVAPASRKILCVPLTSVRNAPETRAMDMKHIAGVILFADASQAGKFFYLVRMWLE